MFLVHAISCLFKVYGWISIYHLFAPITVAHLSILYHAYAIYRCQLRSHAQPSHTYEKPVFRNRRARRKHPDVFEEPAISGRLQDNDVSAFPDTGAAANFISLPYAQRNGIKITKNLRRSVQVGDGSRICVFGTTTLPFSFAGEEPTHDLTFHVLQRSVHDVILGSSFLRASKTFTQFAHRVGRKERESVGPRIYRVHFLGSHQYVRGMANGVGVNASPDTGADVSVMSAKFAKASGFKVNDDERNRISLGFADGSTARARGVVKSVAWRFGANDQEYLTDVYVLSSLPVDLLLGYDFLCQTEAFLEHERDFWHDDDLERENACWRLCIIRRLEGTTKGTGENLSAELWRSAKAEEIELYRKAKEDAKGLGLSDEDAARYLQPHVARWQHFLATQQVQPNVQTTDVSVSVSRFKMGWFKLKAQGKSAGSRLSR